MVKIQNGSTGAKMVSIICASFVLAGHVIFFDCATSLPEVGDKNPSHISMFGGAYGDARMPNWPHWHRTLLPGIATTGLRD